MRKLLRSLPCLIEVHSLAVHHHLARIGLRLSVLEPLKQKTAQIHVILCACIFVR
ncbi:MAG: hypothetical protein MUC48_01410 [Leptolyngbya sp. Prado105]|nr:hypothetical protein [Leptolyngbya sp. Prado105]